MLFLPDLAEHGLLFNELLFSGESAVDYELSARDKRRFVRGKEQDSVGHFNAFALAPQRGRIYQVLSVCADFFIRDSGQHGRHISRMY